MLGENFIVILLRIGEAEMDFERGFSYLGVTFLNSMVMTPYDRPKKERKILFYPPPLDLNEYFKKQGCRNQD